MATCSNPLFHERQLPFRIRPSRMESGHACLSPVRIAALLQPKRLGTRDQRLSPTWNEYEAFPVYRQSPGLCNAKTKQPAYQSDRRSSRRRPDGQWLVVEDQQSTSNKQPTLNGCENIWQPFTVGTVRYRDLRLSWLPPRVLPLRRNATLHATVGYGLNETYLTCSKLHCFGFLSGRQRRNFVP